MHSCDAWIVVWLAYDECGNVWCGQTAQIEVRRGPHRSLSDDDKGCADISGQSSQEDDRIDNGQHDGLSAAAAPHSEMLLQETGQVQLLLMLREPGRVQRRRGFGESPRPRLRKNGSRRSGVTGIEPCNVAQHADVHSYKKSQLKLLDRQRDTYRETKTDTDIWHRQKHANTDTHTDAKYDR